MIEELKNQRWTLLEEKEETSSYKPTSNTDEYRSTEYKATHPSGIVFEITDRHNSFGFVNPNRFVGTTKYEKRVLSKDRTVTYQSKTVFRRTARELLWALDSWAKEIKEDEDSPWGWMLHRWITTKSGRKVYKPGCDDDPAMVWNQHIRDPIYWEPTRPECRICGRTSNIPRRNRNCGNCIKYGTECLEVYSPEDCCDDWATECWMDGWLSKKCLPEENRPKEYRNS